MPPINRCGPMLLILTPLSVVATRRHRGGKCPLGLGLVQYDAQSWRRRRHRNAANVFDQAGTVSFQRADAVGLNPTRARIEQLTNYFTTHDVADQAVASHRAVVATGHIVQKQAYVMAFSDTFFLLGAALIVALVASFMLRKLAYLAVGGAH